MTELERRAVEWWRSKRPVRWTERQHLDNPAVNCAGEADTKLARAAADVVRAGTEGGSDD